MKLRSSNPIAIRRLQGAPCLALETPPGAPCLAFETWVCAAALALLSALGAAHSAAAMPLQQEDPPELVLVSAPASILGVKVADIDLHTADLLHLKSTSGVEVIVVDHDAPAGKAGIHLRDVIIAVDGKQVTSAQQFRETISGYPPGKQVVLSVLRDGKPIRFTIKLADRAKLQQQAFARHFNPPMPSLGNTFSSMVAMQSVLSGDVPAGDGPGGSAGRGSGDDFAESQPQPFGFFGLGAELDPVGPQLASFFGVKEGSGMLVKSVEPGSPAAASGLQAGDVVLKLNDVAVLNPIDWVRAIEASQGKPMQLTIVRNKRVETLTLPALGHAQALLDWPLQD